MKELRCPKCGSIFQVDEADYASILTQVKNREFDEELDRRVAELHARQEAEHKALQAESERASQEKISEKEKQLGQKDSEIALLKGKIESMEARKRLEIGEALVGRDKVIAELRNTIQQNESALQIAVLKEQDRAREEIRSKEMKISELEAQARVDKAEAGIHMNAIKEQYENKLKMAQEQVDYYKELKTRLSTKMVGETLEVHCSTEYNTRLRSLLPDAYFEKDNDASSGSKGDFIFRDYYLDDKGQKQEYISIMFEMKNENETTSSKHKNDQFLAELDKDRREKGCEYAVLVSMLEADSELYNSGIVDKSYMYDKTYVIRPQFFIPLITLLVQTSRKSLEFRKELAAAKSQTVDVNKFEDKLREFQIGFSNNYSTAEKYFESVLSDIDKAIANLEKMKKDLTTTGNQLRLANNKAQELSVRKLVRGNQTMQTMFEQARKEAKLSAGSPDEQ